jgi:hypothetical protein
VKEPALGTVTFQTQVCTVAVKQIETQWAVSGGRIDVLDGFEFAIVYRCDTYAELHFAQDDALLQFALTVSAWLDNLFSDRWIGRGGPTD